MVIQIYTRKSTRICMVKFILIFSPVLIDKNKKTTTNTNTNRDNKLDSFGLSLRLLSVGQDDRYRRFGKTYLR